MHAKRAGTPKIDGYIPTYDALYLPDSVEGGARTVVDKLAKGEPFPNPGASLVCGDRGQQFQPVEGGFLDIVGARFHGRAI